MSAIKKFFEKCKLDVKFKKAGEGHKLTEPNPSLNTGQTAGPSNKKSSTNKVLTDSEMTNEKKMAADAALARLNQKKEIENKGYTKPTMTMKAELLAEKREMESALAQAKKYSSNPKEMKLESSSVVTGVYFKCPMLGIEESLPRDRMEEKIEQFLYSQLTDEPELTSVLMIYTLNKNKEALKLCVETLVKYITNILENPTKPNFRRIRKSNKALNERVLNCKGAIEFLQASGFELKSQKISEDSEEMDEFFVLDFNPENSDEITEKLKTLLEVLRVCEPVKMELDRDLKIFDPNFTSSVMSSKIEVSDDFYNVTAEELKREMKIREEAIKEMGMLRTKQMRERDRQKELRRYRFAVIRVKFPDNYAIQGTFRANENFSEVRNFIFNSIELDEVPFHLTSQTSGRITDDDKTLAELDLAPASILQFSYDEDVVRDVIKQGGNISKNGISYLKRHFKS